MDRLKPRRAVYSDPAWHLASAEPGFGPEVLAGFKSADKERIRAMNPLREEADVDVEAATPAVWDEATAPSPAPLLGRDLLPAAPAPPSLVRLADPGFLIPPERTAPLTELGSEVRSVAGAGHTIHRDDFEGFMASLEGWIQARPVLSGGCPAGRPARYLLATDR
ncbi:hypothetical protein [Streptomyces sp. NPDC017949]|uniref:hypothetical protein n=1 Tax=Streptomyces sp. NPDC017949 TaxID=3365020 RepID=UPI003798DF38